MKRLLGALAALFLLTAEAFGAYGGVSLGSYFQGLTATLTRAANTTTYTANTAVCASTTVVCTPLAFTPSSPSGTLTHVQLYKSGSYTTAASFTIYFFTSSPSVGTTVVKDNVAYVGPYASDMPNYIGYATCTTPLVTNDGTAQVFYDCALSNPAAGGSLPFASTTLYAMIETTSAYVPISAETFTIVLGGYY